MYKLALILFSFLFLVFPILAAPIQGGNPSTPTGGNNGQAQQGTSQQATKGNSQQATKGTSPQATTGGTSFTGTVRAFFYFHLPLLLTFRLIGNNLHPWPRCLW